MELRPSKERMYTAAPSGVEGITAHVQDTMRHGSEHMPRNTHHTNWLINGFSSARAQLKRAHPVEIIQKQV